MKKHASQSQRKRRQELIHILREALPIFSDKDDAELLEFCGLPESTIAADCSWEGIPWSATGLHYYVLGIRAVRARARGRFPNGSVGGSEFPEPTPPYATILARKQPEDTQPPT